MTKEIIGFINKNNDIFNLKEDSSISNYCHKVGQGHKNKIAVFTEDGDVTDSGKNPSDFALVGHSHSAIMDASTESSVSIDEGIISIVIEGEESGGETEINTNNIGNLHRALQDPDTEPIEDSNKLITSSAVKNALSDKANKVSNATAGNLASLDEEGNLQDSGKAPLDFALASHSHDSISAGNTNIAIVNVNDDRIDGPKINFILKTRRLLEKTAEISTSNIDNLNRALTTPSSTPENDNAKLITSKAVFDAIALKQNAEAYGVSLTKESDYYIWNEMDDSEPEQIYGEIKALLPTSNSVAPCILRIDDVGHEVRVIGVINWTAVASADAENMTVHIYVGNKSFDCVIIKDTRTPQEAYSSDGHFIKNDYGQDI